jgi:hypothetical protein
MPSVQSSETAILLYATCSYIEIVHFQHRLLPILYNVTTVNREYLFNRNSWFLFAMERYFFRE